MAWKQKIEWWLMGGVSALAGVVACANFFRHGDVERLCVQILLFAPLLFVFGVFSLPVNLRFVRRLVGVRGDADFCDRRWLDWKKPIGGGVFLAGLFGTLLQGFIAWMACALYAAILSKYVGTVKDSLVLHVGLVTAIVMFIHSIIAFLSLVVRRLRTVSREGDWGLSRT